VCCSTVKYKTDPATIAENYNDDGRAAVMNSLSSFGGGLMQVNDEYLPYMDIITIYGHGLMQQVVPQVNDQMRGGGVGKSLKSYCETVVEEYEEDIKSKMFDQDLQFSKWLCFEAASVCKGSDYTDSGAISNEYTAYVPPPPPPRHIKFGDDDKKEESKPAEIVAAEKKEL